MLKLWSIFIYLLIFLNVANASLYQCLNPEGKPVLAEHSAETIKISYENKDATLLTNAKDPKEHRKKRIPYLIYYAVDSKEPFMQFSVLYEIAQLTKYCKESAYVNFVAILNTLITEQNEIIVCKEKVFKRINLSSFPVLNETLILKRNFIGIGDHTKNQGPMNYLVKYYDYINTAFANFPLAHPDFLFDLVNFIQTEKSLFPAKYYMPFINMKSHGSEETVISGLHSCQIEAKTKTQLEIMKSKLNDQEMLEIKTFNTIEQVMERKERFENIISKLSLGEYAVSAGNTELNNDYNLGGDHNLGISSSIGSDVNLSSSNSFGQSVFGLGTDEGLGTQQAFGLHHITLNAVLNDLYINSEQKMGFVMLESCDTRRETTFKLTYMKSVLGYYSAKHSLWYRNLNWWNILKESENSTLRLINLLEIESKKIVNISIKAGI